MVAKDMKDEIEDPSSDLEKELKHGKEDESDNDTVRDSVSSQGDSQTTEDDKIERTSRVPKKLPKKDSAVTHPRASRSRKDRLEANKTQKTLHSTPTKPAKSNRSNPKDATTTTTTKNVPEIKTKSKKVPPRPSSESSEGFDDKPIEEVKEIDTSNDAPNGSQGIVTDDETSDVEANGVEASKESMNQKMEEMELRIEKLEEELREIAALEIALYSVVPEHGSSSHKVHTPARRLSRIYIHACKHWTQDKRGTVARNTVSGLVLIAKSCGNDVPRLTFWLSNTVVLREIISQAFGSSLTSTTTTRAFETNGGITRSDGKSASVNGKGGAGIKQMKKIDFMQFLDDWQETRTYIAALEKVEAWIFSRIVESVWWQSLTPHMQSPDGDTYSSKSYGRLSGPALGDQQQGCFSINLWTSAFQDAFQRLCPVRAGGHKCGCLPILAKMVMERCVARLDVAMFNAILRESASDIPTDPISDPILDSKVLPIPAGELSFGSGAQLKNSIGNWSRWLTDLFGMDTDESPKAHVNSEDDDGRGSGVELKSFRLLNALSDLLMLPKDMLMDRSIRKEVCPSIGLPLVKRILCNFTPDEFCPDPVPGAVLEALNAESFVERRLSEGDLSSSCFPCAAAPVLYIPPSSADVEEKVADIGGKPQLEKNVSMVQRKGYTSDEELDELDSPLTTIIDKMPQRLAAIGNGNGNGRHDVKPSHSGALRYELLREVWSV